MTLHCPNEVHQLPEPPSLVTNRIRTPQSTIHLIVLSVRVWYTNIGAHCTSRSGLLASRNQTALWPNQREIQVFVVLPLLKSKLYQAH